MLDCRTSSVADVHKNPCSGKLVWTRELNVMGLGALQAGQQIPAEELPYFSPSLADDLSNLPPTFIIVGQMDLFVDEDIAYAKKLLNSGVVTEPHVLAGVYHGFDMAKHESSQPLTYHALRDAFIQKVVE